VALFILKTNGNYTLAAISRNPPPKPKKEEVIENVKDKEKEKEKWGAKR
jgi:hypothetical protein